MPDGMDTELSAAEKALRLAEHYLEKYGARPTDINRRNRELLGQRVTYAFDNSFFRMDIEDFDGQACLILSRIDYRDYAEIGLMEDVDGLRADASEAEIEHLIRRNLFPDNP